MTPEDRRQAILEVLVPLLAERGADVSTRELARAAGIAEGTIFRVFPDKKSLMLAAVEETINPAAAQADFDAAVAGTEELRTQVLAVTARVLERMRLTMAVMMAVRQHLTALHAHADEDARTGAGGAGGKRGFGPPSFVIRAHEDLLVRLTGLFERHRDELATEPSVAARALRSLILGASRPELGLGAALTPDQIADLLLDGVRRRDS